MDATSNTTVPTGKEASAADAATVVTTTAATIEPAPAKSKNADKNDAKRAAKLEKLAAKQAKLQAQKETKGDAGEKAASAKKGKKPDAETSTATPVVEFVNTTPEGEKKDMSAPIAAAYAPRAVESAWYAWWDKQGFFQPALDAQGRASSKGTFVIPIPPPNVTGALHIGHALTVAIQDALIRWNRMLGRTVVFVPGCDHAGISTQVVVEKRLWIERGITRHDLGREAFEAEVWKWKTTYGDRIYGQLHRLGGSYDWSRVRFTMDEALCRAVTEAFVRLHDDGVIYRATRLVNWCTRLNTTLSNLEVENVDVPGRTLMSVPGYDASQRFEFGVLVSFAYPIEGSDERIVVATTRVETMLGDTAVAVHPNDARYQHLHGKFVIHPFNQRRIPIICDDIAVDMEFGTGAVKITPAHDFNDFEVGKRHGLEFINIFNDDGTLNENGAPYAGMKRFDVRVKILQDLQDRGLYVDTKDNPMTVPMCPKTGDVIEPLLKPQWWVNCKEMAAEAMAAAQDGRLEILPKASEKEWFRWLGNIQDWCVSRQLWWGHRVPAYYVRIEGVTADHSDETYWVIARTYEDAMDKARAKFPGKAFTLEQDHDVLDTWFSSGLWPFSIFGWPDSTPDLELFYPNSVLETGWDILFFWVARMVMLGMKLTGKVPFKQVLCHAMIRDAHGRKMSKSLGNVIDPVSVIEGITLEGLHQTLLEGNLDPREVEKAKAGQKADFPGGIPECGTDALRFALCAYTAAGRDINLDILRVEGYRKFCNKLWNATRFALMKLGDDFKPKETADLSGNESLPERWILHKLNRAAADTNAALEERHFMMATSAIHQFWLYELCDVFIEVVKPVIDGEDKAAARSCQDTLYTCLEAGLKLLHPFMPFVTEELFQRLPRRPADATPSICIASFPVEIAEYNSHKAEADFDFLFEAVRAIRSLTTAYPVGSNATVYLRASTEDQHALFSTQTKHIMTLSRCKRIEALSPGSPLPSGCALVTISGECTVQLLVKGIVDIDAEIAKLDGKLDKATKAYDAAFAKTQAPGYETKVKAEIREVNAQKLKTLEAEMDVIRGSIENFKSLKI